jgi:cytochrome c oxidase assembly protein subunit 15
VFATALLCIIVVSGAAVRLTGSGLGCDDWPNCNDERLIDVSSTHAAIEQVNRLFTGLVAVGVMLAVLGSLVRVPRRRDLTWLSLGLVAGVIAQIVLGGITVLTDLHPASVQGHFLLSMVIVANAMVLIHRAGLPEGSLVDRVGTDVRRHLFAIAASTSVVLVLGTVVTGTGPHAGDEDARRFTFWSIHDAAQIHGVSVWVTVALVASLMWRLRSRQAEREVLDGALTAWFWVALGQAGVGYLQYFSGVPAALVALHITLATALWCITVWMVCIRRAVDPSSTEPISATGSVDEAAEEGGALVDDVGEEVAHR